MFVRKLSLFICLSWCFTSQSTAKVMSGRCLHFMGLLPKMRMSGHSTSTWNITTIQPSQTWRFAPLHNPRKLKTCVILSQLVEFSEKDDFITLTFDELYEIIQD